MWGLRAVVTLVSLSLVQALTISSNSSNATSTAPVTRTISLALANSTSSAANSSTTFTNAGASCNAAKISWSQASVQYSSKHPIVTVATNTVNYTSTVHSTNIYNCTRTCGTICYAGPTTLDISTTAVFSTYPVTYTTGAEYPSASPNCSISTSDCLSLKTSFSSASMSWWSLSDAQRSATPSPIQPSCSACIATGCTFAHAGMSLYYWPVTANVSRDYCAYTPAGGPATISLPNPNSTYVETTTGPYAVVDGVTMFSGNIYLSMMEPFVTDNCGNQITRKSPGHNIITMASSDLYSVRGYPHNVIPWSVNWDDFNEPTPWSAYAGGWYCANNRPICSVVFPHNYHPVMSMPGQIRYLDPNWASCSFDQYGIFDPPTALHSVGDIFASSASPTASTTDPQSIVSPTPDPGQSPSGSGPSATARPPTTTTTGAADPGHSSDPSGPQDPASSTGNAAPGSSPETNPAATGGGSPGTTAGGGSPGSASPPVITVGPTVVPVDPTSGVVINPGTTLTSGGSPVVISDTTFSIGTGGLTIVSPSTSSVVSFGNSPVTIPVGGSSVTLDPAGTVVVGGTTLSPGGSAVTVDGSTLSFGSSGIVVVDPSGTTSTIAVDPSSPQVVRVGSSTFTVTGGNVVIAPGTTIGFGDPAVTISGTTFSVGPSGLVVIGSSGTSTVPISMATQVVTIGSHTYTLYNGDLVLGPGTTIGVGDPAVTVDGTTYTMASTGLVVLSSGGGTTVPVTGTGTKGSSVTPTGSDRPGFTGGVGMMEWDKRWMMVVVVEVVVGLMV